MSTTTVVMPVAENMHKPETGVDTVIAELVGATDPNAPQIGVTLARMAFEAAHDMGANLRMAAWWVTTEPEVVQQRGMSHDCVTCRAGVDQALAHMKAHPEALMAVGLLSWCGE